MEFPDMELGHLKVTGGKKSTERLTVLLLSDTDEAQRHLKEVFLKRNILSFRNAADATNHKIEPQLHNTKYANNRTKNRGNLLQHI